MQNGRQFFDEARKPFAEAEVIHLVEEAANRVDVLTDGVERTGSSVKSGRHVPIGHGDANLRDAGVYSVGSFGGAAIRLPQELRHVEV
jgi:hypothetical protein